MRRKNKPLKFFVFEVFEQDFMDYKHLLIKPEIEFWMYDLDVCLSLTKNYYYDKALVKVYKIRDIDGKDYFLVMVYLDGKVRTKAGVVIWFKKKKGYIAFINEAGDLCFITENEKEIFKRLKVLKENDYILQSMKFKTLLEILLREEEGEVFTT